MEINKSTSPQPENLAEEVVRDMERRAHEAGTNLSELLKQSFRGSESSPFKPEDFDPDC